MGKAEGIEFLGEGFKTRAYRTATLNAEVIELLFVMPIYAISCFNLHDLFVKTKCKLIFIL